MQDFKNKHIKTRSLKSLIKEVLEEKTTASEFTTLEYIDKLSKYLGYPVVSGPYQDTYVVELEEPHYIFIKHIVRDVFDFTYFRDSSDRVKGTYVQFDELKKKLKELLDNRDNFVDSAYKKSVENSKDKEKKGNSVEQEKHTVKYSAKEKIEEAEDMNDEKDNPDQPMEEVSDYKKMMDYKETKVKYTQPKLGKEDKKITVKLEKTEKFK